MSSAGVTLSGSKEYWKGTDFIERKLGSVLDRKVASSTKQVLLDRINFKEASKPDPFYTELKNQYKPLNAPLDKQHTDRNTTSGKKATDSIVNNVKDELPAPKYILFEREKINLQWKHIRKVGPGLFNLGNTCFLNSVIQVLTYTPPLVNYLATQEHSRNCKTVGFCMLCELQRHVLRTFGHNQNEAIKPMAIIQKLKHIAKHLRFGHQEDSHEFLRYVIDGMLKSCLAGVPEKLDIYTKRTTMIHHVFGGYFRSQVTCERCHHTSSTYDPLMEVLLDIKQSHSVQKSFQRLTSVELLNGDNMYLCPRCKKKVAAKKHLTVHRPPNVMTMCLKRFDCHSLFGTKVNKEVVYPEQLNLRPFMSKNQGPPVNYKLYAVLVHSGYSCNSGHYYCFIKASNGTWYQMNDATVRQVCLKTALSQQAYILFYIRQPHIHKERPNHVSQPHVQSQTMNGVKSWKSENLAKKNAPKIISVDKKVLNKQLIGQPVPRKPEFLVNKQPTPTTIPETREKVSFTLNHSPPQKKLVTLTTGENKEHFVQPESLSSTPSSLSDSTATAEKELGRVDINEQGGDTENKPVTEKENVKKENEVRGVDELDSKEPNEKQRPIDIHATTKWKVTPTTVGPVPPGGTRRERTPSLSSDVSSITSKTGDWAVTDRSTTQFIGPRLPERQHAGWIVSTTTEEVDKDEKKSESTAKSDETSEKTEEEAYHKKSKKRKHSKDKEKKSKFRKTDDETRLLSDESREASESDESREKLRKKKKRSKKVKKVGTDSDSSDVPREHEKRKKAHKKSKKKKKRKKRSPSDSETDGRDLDENRKLTPKKETEKSDNMNNLVKKATELLSKVGDISKKRDNWKPLVQYSDHSSSSEEESRGKTGDSKGSSRSSVEREKHRKDNTKSWSAGEYPTCSSRHGDRKHVVDMLMENSRNTSNYGCQVEKWDDEKVLRVEVEVRDRNHEESSKRRRDEGDEEYDRGKVKRNRKKDSFLNRTYPCHNQFQREYDRKRMKPHITRHDGWHYSSSSSSSSRWHNRSSDRYSRRDRR